MGRRDVRPAHGGAAGGLALEQRSPRGQADDPVDLEAHSLLATVAQRLARAAMDAGLAWSTESGSSVRATEVATGWSGTSSRNDPATQRWAVRSLVAECTREPVKRQMIVKKVVKSRRDRGNAAVL